MSTLAYSEEWNGSVCATIRQLSPDWMAEAMSRFADPFVVSYGIRSSADAQLAAYNRMKNEGAALAR
jgi:hypothetical protein